MVAYICLQLSILKLQDYTYSIVNAVGSLLILFSLYHHWNFSSFVIETAWFFVSIFGIFQAWRAKRKKIQLDK